MCVINVVQYCVVSIAKARGVCVWPWRVTLGLSVEIINSSLRSDKSMYRHRHFCVMAETNMYGRFVAKLASRAAVARICVNFIGGVSLSRLCPGVILKASEGNDTRVSRHGRGKNLQSCHVSTWLACRRGMARR